MPISTTTKAMEQNGILQSYRWAIGYVCAGLSSFFLCLITSVVILPAGLWVNRGFSFYGDMASTVLPYRLAFLLCGTCLLLSAQSLPAPMPFRVMRVALRVMFPLLVGVMITTVPNSPALDQVHRGIGVTLFLVQFSLGGWLSLVVHRDRCNLAFFLLLLFGGVLSLLGLLNVLPYLIEGQAVFLLAFGLVVVYTMARLRIGVTRTSYDS